MREHNFSGCTFTNKRRDVLVTHLSREHRIYEQERGRALAESWRRASGKKFWSCGFCLRLFSTFKDRLDHIGNEHFKKGQTLDDWAVTNVVLGLLLQPELVSAWEEKLRLVSCWDHASLTWDSSTSSDLQHKLEMGPSNAQSAQSLVELAFMSSQLPTTIPFQNYDPDTTDFSYDMTGLDLINAQYQIPVSGSVSSQGPESMPTNSDHISYANDPGYGRTPTPTESNLNEGCDASANAPSEGVHTGGPLEPPNEADDFAPHLDPTTFSDSDDLDFANLMTWNMDH